MGTYLLLVKDPHISSFPYIDTTLVITVLDSSQEVFVLLCL